MSFDNDWFKNQYLITNNAKISIPGWHCITPTNSLYIHSHPFLNDTCIQKKHTFIVLLGFIFDPLNPDYTFYDIIENLINESPQRSDFFKNIQALTGRYVLIYNDESNLLVTPDACGLRQIYYGKINGKKYITSSIKLPIDLTKETLQISQNKKDFINSRQYEINEQAWLGDQSYDDRFKKVLPNHYLKFNSFISKRIPFFEPKITDNYNKVLNYAKKILTNSFKTIKNRYKVILPVTAGLDSRILLAASREYKTNIEYYIFERKEANFYDSYIPDKLMNKLQMDFTRIKAYNFTDKFLQKYKENHYFSRILPKTKFINYHYKNSDSDTLNITGNCSEITRFYYDYPLAEVSGKYFARICNYKNNSYAIEQINKWLDDAKYFCYKNSIDLRTLFYWEQRMGNWGAQFPFEQDIAIEEFAPYNNRELILSILTIPQRNRKYPRYKFRYDLMRNLWEEILQEKINPETVFEIFSEILYSKVYFPLSYKIRKILN